MYSCRIDEIFFYNEQYSQYENYIILLYIWTHLELGPEEPRGMD